MTHTPQETDIKLTCLIIRYKWYRGFRYRYSNIVLIVLGCILKRHSLTENVRSTRRMFLNCGVFQM